MTPSDHQTHWFFIPGPFGLVIPISIPVISQAAPARPEPRIRMARGRLIEGQDRLPADRVTPDHALVIPEIREISNHINEP